jgi:hypothetical protein
MDDAKEAVAAEVRAQLARHRRTGKSMATELGWTQIYLWRRLTGKVAFDVEDLAAIAGALKVPVTSFWPEGFPSSDKGSISRYG